MMTLNREILMHPDFTSDLADELCSMLEAIIDAEFEKGENTDFDFIDECADAINAIRSGDTSKILPLVSRREFMKKVGIRTERKLKILVAAAAAIALVLISGMQIEVKENITVVQALSGIVSEIFAEKTENEITTQPVTAKPQPTEEQTTSLHAQITGITVETDENFRTEYYVGEEFIKKGIKVFADYSNGERKITGFDAEIPDTFASKPGYETVKIKSNGYEETLEVRIIVSETTPVLSSVYAVFPEEYDFKVSDTENPDLTQMQVYAVYSNGDERELTAEEYTLDVETKKSLFKEEAFVTVSYEGCSCSFMVFKE